jgi:uncharacterized membrane protein
VVPSPASGTEPPAPVDGVGPVDESPVVRAVPGHLVARLIARLQRVTLWQWALVAAIAGYTSYFTNLTLDVHHGLGTSAYDFGLYDQGVWLMSRFRAPFVTLMGRNLMGDHTSFILVLLVPIYWLFPSAGALFFTQSLAIALGAVPVFLLGKRLLGNEWMSLLLAVCYLIHPAVAWTNRENFHPDAYIAPLIGMAIYAAIDRRWRMYAVFVFLSLMVKEDASLVLVPLGIWVALKRDRRIGLLTVGASVTYMLVAMFLVMRSLIGVPTRNAWRIPFGGPSGLIKTALTRPMDLVRHYWSDNRPFYFWQMTMPFAFAFAWEPSVALISLLVLATNMLSTFWYQYQIQYHYALVAVPALAMGTVWAISKMHQHRRSVAVALVVVTSVWSAYMWGAVPFSRNLPYYWPPDHPVAVDARSIIADIPADAVVSAQYSVTAHLARRDEIYMFPTPFSAELYGADDSLAYQRLPAADRVEFVVLPATLEGDDQAIWDHESSAFTLIEQNTWWRLYQRTSMVTTDPIVPTVVSP